MRSSFAIISPNYARSRPARPAFPCRFKTQCLALTASMIDIRDFLSQQACRDASSLPRGSQPSLTKPTAMFTCGFGKLSTPRHGPAAHGGRSKGAERIASRWVENRHFPQGSFESAVITLRPSVMTRCLKHCRSARSRSPAPTSRTGRARREFRPGGLAMAHKPAAGEPRVGRGQLLAANSY